MSSAVCRKLLFMVNVAVAFDRMVLLETNNPMYVQILGCSNFHVL